MKNLAKNLFLIGLIISAFAAPALASDFGNISGNIAFAVCLFLSGIALVSTLILLLVSTNTVIMALFASNTFFAVISGISFIYFSVYYRGVENYLMVPFGWFALNIAITTFKVGFPSKLRVFLGYGAVPLIVCGALFCVSWKITPVHINENVTKQETFSKEEKPTSNIKEKLFQPKEQLPPENEKAPTQPNRFEMPTAVNSLEVAIMEGDRKNVAKLIAQGADVNNEEKGTYSPLMLASAYGKTDIVKQLIAAGADVNKRVIIINGNGEYLTALKIARANKWPEIVEILLAAGAVDEDMNQRRKPKKTYASDDPYILLLDACIDGKTETVAKLLKDGVKPTPEHLVAAANEKQSQVLKQLLAAGLDVNQPTEDGEYALLYVVSFGTLEDIGLFIKYGADLTVSYPAKGGGYIGPALVLATLDGDLPKVKYLVEHKANVGLANKSGSTPLLVASSKGYKDIVAFLIESGASVNMPNNHKDTPLMVAAESGNTDTVKCLLDAGAKINSRNKNGDTALMFAAASGNPDIVKLLINAGADLNLVNKDEQTALVIAQRKGQNQTVEILKRASARS